jgi:hypothetical protein
LGEQIKISFVCSSTAASSLSALKPKWLVEQHLAVFHIVCVGCHLIHAIGRFYRHHVIDLRLAESAVYEVDGLIAAVAEEYLFGTNLLLTGYDFLQVAL